MTVPITEVDRLRRWTWVVLGAVAFYVILVSSVAALKTITTSTDVRSLLKQYHASSAKKLDANAAEIAALKVELADQRAQLADSQAQVTTLITNENALVAVLQAGGHEVPSLVVPKAVRRPTPSTSSQGKKSPTGPTAPPTSTTRPPPPKSPPSTLLPCLVVPGMGCIVIQSLNAGRLNVPVPAPAVAPRPRPHRRRGRRH